MEPASALAASRRAAAENRDDFGVVGGEPACDEAAARPGKRAATVAAVTSLIVAAVMLAMVGLTSPVRLVGGMWLWVRVRPEARAVLRWLLGSFLKCSRVAAFLMAFAAMAWDAVSKGGGDFEHFGELNEFPEEGCSGLSFLPVIFLKEFFSWTFRSLWTLDKCLRMVSLVES